ncbi:MAG: isoprenylcysteine carboxylmethyltransferase family protein [Novosphingobium sp.]
MDQGAVAAGRTGWLKPAILDRGEQVIIVALWTLLAMRVDHSVNPLAPLLLASETAVALFVLIRRPTGNISMRLGDWLLAITATAAPLLIMPGANPFPQLMIPGIALIVFGNVWQVAAKLVLRRSFGIAPANRGIKISGPYRFMRHPMYAGYLLSHIGVMMLMASPLNFALYVICWTAQVRRLMAEEQWLARDPAYREYMGKVRWRLIPGIF